MAKKIELDYDWVRKGRGLFGSGTSGSIAGYLSKQSLESVIPSSTHFIFSSRFQPSIRQRIHLFPLPLSPPLPFPPSELWRRMDKVCTSPWLNCRSADVAPSPLTAWWRLYLSLYDAVALTDTQARSYRNTLAGACLCWYLQKTHMHWTYTQKNARVVSAHRVILHGKKKKTHTQGLCAHSNRGTHPLSIFVCLSNDTFITPFSLPCNQH